MPKEIKFKDYPDFTPNLSPEEMFRLGSFGGTYWRPIKSNITRKSYENQHKEFPDSWWEGLPDNWLISNWKDYDCKNLMIDDFKSWYYLKILGKKKVDY